MRVLVLILALLAACRPPGGGGGGPTPVGAPNSRAALDMFLASAKAQDLEAMSRVWGTARGPVRDEMDRQERERRQLVIMCYVNHDSYRVLSETPGESERTLSVELTRGDLRRTTNFVTVRGPGGRWFLQEAQIQPLTDFCRTPPTTPPPGTR